MNKESIWTALTVEKIRRMSSVMLCVRPILAAWFEIAKNGQNDLEDWPSTAKVDRPMTLDALCLRYYDEYLTAGLDADMLEVLPETREEVTGRA